MSRLAAQQARNSLAERLEEPRLLRHDLFLDGAWQASSSGERFDVSDPATGETLGAVASATREDVQRAIAAADRAFGPWAALTAKERAVKLRRWHDLLVEHADDLAAILTAEQGKHVGEARDEVLYGAAFIEWFAEEGKRAYGDVIPTNVSTRRLLALKQPIGVCAAITPWNFPAAMIARKAGPALAAGCTLVVKPASATPYSALAMAELASWADIPAGVFNVVTGAASVVGDELLSNPLVRKVTFTGSTEVGKRLMAQAAGTVKNVSLELGGNAPLVVFADADLDLAVAGAVQAKFRNSGQTCVCANRILVQAEVYDAFLTRFTEATSRLSVGNGFEPNVDQGPLIDEAAIAKVESHITDALDHGASVTVGGNRVSASGTFFAPTVLAGATAAMRIAHEETFGPVAPVFKFETEEEGVRLANQTEHGLAAYFFTRDLARTWRVGEALEFGVIGVNTGLISYEGAPFGGVKESGIGREGSRSGLEEFLEEKYLCVAGL